MELNRGFQPTRLVNDLIAGLVSGGMNIIIALSFAALIFSGPLSAFFARGVGMALFAAAVISAVIALTSSLRGVQAGPQDTPAAVLALVAAQISQTMAGSATQEAVYATVVAAIAMTSLLTGLFFVGIGRLRLGNLVRFMPYPVIGGFLAGTGWLLVVGSLGVMGGYQLTISQVGALFQPGALLKWLPGLVFAVLLLVAMRRFRQPWVMPLLLVLGLVSFYGILLITGTSLEAARAGGWLMKSMPEGSLFHFSGPSLYAQVDWRAIFQEGGQISTILIIGAISLLLNASGLELVFRQDVDYNRELQAAGLANILTSLGGGLAGYHFLGDSVLAFKIGGRSRTAGLVCAAVSAGVLFFGSSVVSFFPTIIAGGLLLFLGLSFLVEWLYDAWFKLPRLDYVMVLAILVVISTVGFLQGVAAGMGIAVFLFVLNYSRVQVVRHSLTGKNYRSRVDRAQPERQRLRENGEQIWLLKLQGFLFFGTASNLVNIVRQRLTEPGSQMPKFIVLDFSRVSGLDSSTAASFARMKQLADARDVQIAMANLAPSMLRQLKRSEEDGLAGVHFYPTPDEAMEWCENQILAFQPQTVQTEDPTPVEPPAPLEQFFPNPEEARALLAYLEKMDYGAGDQLIRQGDPADALYLVESGAATAILELPDGRSLRLRTTTQGTIFGEVGLYLGQVRTASVMLTEPTTLFRLSRSAMAAMERDAPQLAAIFHKRIAVLLSERLAENNDTLAALMD